jgi:hypothetical protein
LAPDPELGHPPAPALPPAATVIGPSEAFTSTWHHRSAAFTAARLPPDRPPTAAPGPELVHLTAPPLPLATTAVRPPAAFTTTQPRRLATGTAIRPCRPVATTECQFFSFWNLAISLEQFTTAYVCKYVCKTYFAMDITLDILGSFIESKEGFLIARGILCCIFLYVMSCL